MIFQEPLRLASICCSAILIFVASAPAAQAAMTYTASAFSDSGNALDRLELGDRVTIDITLRSDGGGGIAGIGAAATGYDPDLLRFDSGQVTDLILSPACVTGIGCFPGLMNLHATQGVGEAVHPLGVFVQFLTAVDVTASLATGQTGEEDFGVITGLRGDPQFRLIFEAHGLGTTTIEIGSDPNYGNALTLTGGSGGGVVNGVALQFTVIPEPGTGVLLGLGLTGLARSRRV